MDTVKNEWDEHYASIQKFDDESREIESKLAVMTPEQREAYDDYVYGDVESEIRAERYNEYTLEKIDLGPSEDDAYERYLESMESR